MINEIKINGLAELPRATSELLAALGGRRHVAFEAPMGAGKTTLIAEMCRQLGVGDDIGSPTFSIVNEYRDRGGEPIYHFDFYRINDLREAIDMGLEDYFYTGGLCLMEWPLQVEAMLPDDIVWVSIEPQADGTRTVRIKD